MNHSDVDRIADWLVRRGLEGMDEVALLAAFCGKCREAGLPISRALAFIDTLHPVHEGRVVRWRDDGVEEPPSADYDRTDQGDAAAAWRRSPFHHLLQTGEEELRRRIGFGEEPGFTMMQEARDQGHTDYLVFVHRFARGRAIGEMDCVYSAWSTRHAEGFSEANVAAMRRLVPAIALALKSGALARIAGTLVEVYLGRDAGRRVLDGRIRRGVADRIEAALWFSDLRSFTTITDTARPGEIIPLLNDYAEAVITAIQEAGGDVLKLIGDGTLAIFTADDPAEACRRALDAEARLRRHVEALNERRRAEERPTTSVYIGLHIGEVFYGNIGSTDRLDFTVVGPAVNEASRIASMCRSVDRPLLVSQAFADALPAEHRARLVSVGRFALRGVGRAQDLFTLDPALFQRNRREKFRRPACAGSLPMLTMTTTNNRPMRRWSWEEKAMADKKRRTIIKLAGSAAAVASTGMAGILATGRSPAFAQQKTVHWLKWVDFVPATDQMFNKEMMPAAEKALGIKIKLETVNGNDLQPRITSGIQSGAGPDLIMSFNSYTHLYANSVVDLSDLAEDVGKKEGGIYKYARAICSDGKMFMGMPWAVIGGMIAYRKSWFDEVGVTKFPETWEEYRAAGKKLKAKGHPIGQTLGHTFGDAPGFSYPLMWSWGGKEVDADGKTVVINSKETIESVKFMTAFWKEAHDEGGLAWDDTNNNRAFLSQTISATLNGASIYIETLRKPEQYQTEKGTPMNKDILHAPLPKGPAGQFGFHLLQSNMLMKYSKNQDAAKEFLKYLHTEANYRKFFESQKGFATPCTAKWESDKLWDVDPVMAPFKVAAKLGQSIGFSGSPNAKAQEAFSKYIITDMYAKAVQGMPAEEAVKWAESELKKIYSA